MTEKQKRPVSDGLVNVAANLGTARDKAAYSAYAYSPLGYEQLLASYRSAWLPRAIVDIPAQDATRKWRSWQAEADQITKIEKVEKRLRVRDVVLQGLTAARLFGGAAIYISTGEREAEKPLDPSKIKNIKSLTVLTPMQLNPGQINRDIYSDYYGRPEHYELQSGGKAATRIHASRLVVLEGASVPDISLQYTGWGDSVLQSTMDAVLQADSANANINSLIFEAKVDVFRFSNLGLEFKSGGDDLISQRLSAQATIKGINGAVVLDKEDEYDQKNASFGSLPDLMDRFMNNVAGASRIPVTRLFGRASVGLSGTGDGDERVYFDHINHLQATEIEPALHMLDECLIWIALGSRPEAIYYTWNPLRQVTEKERADIFKTTADAARAIAGANAGELVPVDALSDALVNELVEQGVLPGLEQKVAEYGTLYEQEDLAARQTDPDDVLPPPNAEVADAKPRTLYVRRDVINASEIIAHFKAQGIETTLPADDLHVTIAFSREPVDWIEVGESWSGSERNGNLEITPGGARVMERLGDGSAVVMIFASSDLRWRHEAIKEKGASWDWPDYQPHITLSYSHEGDLSGIEPWQGKIVLGPEVFEEVDEDWRARVTEE